MAAQPHSRCIPHAIRLPTHPLMWVVSLPPVIVIEPDRTRIAQPASPPFPDSCSTARTAPPPHRRPSRRRRRWPFSQEPSPGELPLPPVPPDGDVPQAPPRPSSHRRANHHRPEHWRNAASRPPTPPEACPPIAAVSAAGAAAASGGVVPGATTPAPAVDPTRGGIEFDIDRDLQRIAACLAISPVVAGLRHHRARGWFRGSDDDEASAVESAGRHSRRTRTGRRDRPAGDGHVDRRRARGEPARDAGRPRTHRSMSTSMQAASSTVPEQSLSMPSEQISVASRTTVASESSQSVSSVVDPDGSAHWTTEEEASPKPSPSASVNQVVRVERSRLVSSSSTSESQSSSQPLQPGRAGTHLVIIITPCRP